MVKIFKDELVVSECSATIIAKYLDWINEEILIEGLITK